MKPILDRVIILQDIKEETSKGGIILGNQAPPKPTGVIVGKGSQVTEVELGDRVLFNANHHQTFKNPDDGKMYVTIVDKDILAVLEGEDFTQKGVDGSAIQVVK